MSTDQMCLKIVEYGLSDTGEDVVHNTTYVFYDRYLQTFGIRGGYRINPDNLIRTKINEYSFYCDKRADTLNYLKLLCKSFYKLSMMLVQYDGADFSTDSDEMTFSELVKNDFKSKEIVGFNYDDSKGPNGQLKEFIQREMESFLQAIETVYNVY